MEICYYNADNGTSKNWRKGSSYTQTDQSWNRWQHHFFFHFQTQVDLYSLKASPYDPVPIFWARQGPRNPLNLFSFFFFQSGAYWQKQTKWVNIHSMTDEEAVAGIPKCSTSPGSFSSAGQAHHHMAQSAGPLPTNWLIFPCSGLATTLQVKNVQDSRVCWMNEHKSPSVKLDKFPDGSVKKKKEGNGWHQQYAACDMEACCLRVAGSPSSPFSRQERFLSFHTTPSFWFRPRKTFHPRLSQHTSESCFLSYVQYIRRVNKGSQLFQFFERRREKDNSLTSWQTSFAYRICAIAPNLNRIRTSGGLDRKPQVERQLLS